MCVCNIIILFLSNMIFSSKMTLFLRPEKHVIEWTITGWHFISIFGRAFGLEMAFEKESGIN